MTATNNLLLSVPEIQRIGNRMLEDVSNICEKHNIKYVLCYGSLLGAIRHNGPIPWDWDIDIFVCEEDMPKFLEHISEDLDKEFWLDYRTSGVRPRLFPRIGLKGYDTENLHIDVFRTVGLPKNKFKRFIFQRYYRLIYILWKAKTVNVGNAYALNKGRGKIVSFLKKILKPIDVNFIVKLHDDLFELYPDSEDIIPPVTLGKVKHKNIFKDTILWDYSGFKVRIPKDYDVCLTKQYGDYMVPPEEEITDKLMKQKIEILAITTEND